MLEPRRRSSARDWPQVSRDVARAYFPHELRPLGSSHEPRLTLRTLTLGPLLIGHVGWGADVAIECDYPGALEINMPLTGHLESRGRFGTVTSVAGQGTVFRPNTPSLISHWDATCIVLGVKIDSAWLEVEAERVLAMDRVRVATLLPERLDLETGAGRTWRQLVLGVATQLHQGEPLHDNELFAQHLAGAITTGLLTTFLEDGPAAGVAQPRAVRRVIEQLHADPARPWSAGELAALAGTSVRRLQEAFRRAVDCTPMQYLTDVRLQRAHADLLADPALTVSDAAARWGFSSPSRLAAAHRRRYGQAPTQARR